MISSKLVATYDELSKAIAATGEDAADKIVLTENIVVPGSEDSGIDILRDVIIDLNGHQISKSGTKDKTVRIFNVGGIGSIDSGPTVKIDTSVGGGKLIGKTAAGATGVNEGDAVVLVNDNSTLEIGKVSIESEYYGISEWKNSKLIVKGATITTEKCGAVAINGASSQGAEATIQGGTYISKKSPAFFWPNTTKISISNATIGGAGGLDIRNGEAELTNIIIRMNGTASDSVGDSGPANFNVGIGVYTTTNGSYGNPSVVLQNVTIEKAKGANVDAQIYYGTLVLSQNSFSEMVNAAGTVTSGSHHANLVIKDKGEKVQTSISSTEANTSMVMLSIDGKRIFGDAVLNKVAFVGDVALEEGNGSVTVGGGASYSGTVSYEGTEAQLNLESGTITAGSVGIGGTVTGTVNGVAGDVYFAQNANLSGTVTIEGNVTAPGNFSINGNAVVYVNGVFDASKSDIGDGATIVAAPGAKVTLPTNASADVEYVGDRTQFVNLPASATPATVVTVPDFDALKAGIDAGMKEFKAGAAITITSNLTVPSDVKIDMNSKKLAVGEGASLFNEGAISGVEAMSILGKVENSGTMGVTSALSVGDDDEDSAESGKVTTKLENSGVITMGGNGIVYRYSKIENSGAFAAASGAANNQQISGMGTFENLSGGVVGFAVVCDDVIGETYDVEMTKDITGSITHSALQNVIVPKDAVLTIQRSAVVTICGTLTVEGTLNVEGELVIASANGAKLIINGTVNVTAEKNPAGKLTIGKTGQPGYASVASDAKLIISEKASMTLDAGNVVVDGIFQTATGSVLGSAVDYVAATKDTPAAGIIINGSADLEGLFATNNNKIAVLGSVSIDNGANTSAAAAGSLEVRIASKDATVSIASFIILKNTNSLVVTDAGLVLSKDASFSTGNSVGFVGNANQDYSVIAGPITIVENVTSKKVGGVMNYTVTMDVAGSISSAPKTSITGTTTVTQETLAAYIATMTFSGQASATSSTDGNAWRAEGGIAVSGELKAGSYIAIANAGVLDVSGTLTANGNETRTIANAADGIISVTGTIVSNGAIAGGLINAAYYVIKETSGTTTVTTHYYSTLKDAVEAVADSKNTNTSKVVTVKGTITVEESFEILSGVTVDVEKNAKLNIGKSTDRTVVLDVAAGAKMSTVDKGAITVVGSLVFGDKTNDSTKDTVSDVTVEDAAADGKRTYTNIYTAISDAAKSTEDVTVKITKKTGSVDIAENLTVPSNVTLVVNDADHSAYLLVKDGVTLTIEGVVKSGQLIMAETVFNTTAMNVDGGSKSSTIVVSGTMMISEDNEHSYGVASNSTASAPIAGAYYSVDGYSVVSTLAVAQADLAKITSDISIYGAVSAGDLSFEATDGCKRIIVAGDKDASVKDMNEKDIVTSLTVSSLTISKEFAVQAVKALTGDVKNVNGTVALKTIVGLTVTENSDAELIVSGAVEATVKNASMAVSAGTVKTGTAFTYDGDVSGTTKNYLTIGKDATLAVDVNVSDIDYLKVQGVLSIASGKSMTVTGVLQNLGTIDVDAATSTSSKGDLAVTGDMYIGMTKTNITKGTEGSAANMNGPFNATTAYISSAAALDDAAVDSLASKHTTFNAGSKAWFTVYAESGEVEAPKYAPVENADLKSWNSKADGSGTAVECEKDVEIGKNENLYSIVDTEIYDIVLNADEGVADVYITSNGVQTKMAYGLVGGEGGVYYAYTATVSAGTYTVTFTAKNGWDGTNAKLAGDNVSGMTFTCSGTEKTDISLQLTGFSKTGYVDPTPVTPSEDKDDGMTITDYLLIVLVVLIVIMAVIVAMRLMRS